MKTYGNVNPLARTVAVTWKNPTPGSQDRYSTCGHFVAVFKHNYGGYACYWTFKMSNPSRRMADALYVGGLPKTVQA